MATRVVSWNIAKRWMLRLRLGRLGELCQAKRSAWARAKFDETGYPMHIWV